MSTTSSFKPPLYSTKPKSQTYNASRKARKALKGRFKNLKRFRRQIGRGNERRNQGNFSDYNSSGDEHVCSFDNTPAHDHTCAEHYELHTPVKLSSLDCPGFDSTSTLVGRQLLS